MEVYLVGGAVRDKLLGLQVDEKDWVVVGATPEEMLAQGYRQVGKDFPVFLHPQTRDEYALARTERKTGPGYKGFVFHTSPDVSLEQDLMRRDLTINAMAEAADGTLIDPCHGQDDLRDGLLRHVSPAFAEDPVRILRVARFAAQFGKWGFKVAHGTNALMRRMVDNGEVDHLVPERVWAELAKALASEAPHKFFTVLHGCGALAVLFPEIEREYRQDSATGSHGHSIAALERLQQSVTGSADPRVRFGALLLALGGDQDREQRIRQAGALCKRFRVPNDYARLGNTAIAMEPSVNSNSAEAILNLLEAAGALRHNDAWQRLLAVYQLSGHIDDARAACLVRAGEAAAGINAAGLQDPPAGGPALGAAIRARRLEVIAAILSATD